MVYVWPFAALLALACLNHFRPVKDISNVMTRMCDVLIARVFERDAIYELAKHAHCPVINALCNMEHPCQVVADL